MIIDAEARFSNAQAVTSAAGSDNTYDQGVAGGRGLGVGEDIYLVVQVHTTLGDGGANTGTAVALEGDSTESFTPDGTDTLFTFAKDAVAGTTKIAKLSPYMAALAYRYLRLKYTPAGANLTSGKFNAFLTKDISAFAAYADAIIISG